MTLPPKESGSGEPGPERPPRLADWILERLLPAGKRGESIRGDLREEFRGNPSPAWYWAQTIRLAIRYAVSKPPQRPLNYPKSGPMFELTSDLKAACRSFMRAPGTD